MDTMYWYKSDILPTVYIHLKVGYVFFQKRFKKLSPVPKQICSQLAVRGVSTHDPDSGGESAQCTWRTLAEMADEKNKRGKRLRTKEGLHRVYTGRHAATAKVCLH